MSNWKSSCSQGVVFVGVAAAAADGVVVDDEGMIFVYALM